MCFCCVVVVVVVCLFVCLFVVVVVFVFVCVGWMWGGGGEGLNTCRALHLRMTPKHFTMATIALFSVSTRRDSGANYPPFLVDSGQALQVSFQFRL